MAAVKFSASLLVHLAVAAAALATVAMAQETDCGRPTLSADSAGGQLVSRVGYPDSPALLGNRSAVDCAWQLESPPGSALAVQFQSLGLTTPDDCVELADSAGWRPQLAACGSAAAAAAAASGYVSGGPVISLRAKLSAMSGFRLAYRFYKPADCARQLRVGGSNGSVDANSRLAGRQCPSGINWRWNFTVAPNFGSDVTGFVLDIVNASLYAADDCLIVSGANGSELARRCGSSVRQELLQWGGLPRGGLTLSFVAASALDGRQDWNAASGFSARFAWVRVCASNGQTVNISRTPTVIEHRPAAYTGWYFCSWTVSAPAGQQLTYQLEPPGLPSNAASCLGFAGTGASWSRLCGGDVGGVGELVLSDGVTQLSYLSGVGPGDAGFRVTWTSADTYCGQLIWNGTSSGWLSSHRGFPSVGYPANLNCSWLAPYTPGSMLLVTVNRLSLADSSDCVIFNEATASSSYCGPVEVHPNASFSLSSSGGLSVRFVTDSRGGAVGFQLSIGTVQITSAAAACNATSRYINASLSGFIYSHPGYGSEPYSNNADCGWQVASQPGAGELLAWFEDLQLEACCDRVYVYDGALESPARRLLGSASSEALEWPSVTIYNASSGLLSVRLSTDTAGTARGFRMRYSTMAGLRRDCSLPYVLAGPSGRVQSHLDLGLVGYSGSSSCSWSLPGSLSRQLLIRFDQLNLRPGDCLSVFNASITFQRYCGDAGVLDGPSRQLLLNTEFPVTVRLEAVAPERSYYDVQDRSRGFALRYFWVKDCPSNGQTILNGEGLVGGNSSSAAGLDSSTYYYCSWNFKPAASHKFVYRFDSSFLPNVNSCAIIDTRSLTGINSSQVFSGSRAAPLPIQAQSADVAEATISVVLKSVVPDFLIRYFVGYVCGSLTWNNSTSGSLRSHSINAMVFPAIQNFSCQWRVSVPAGSQLTVQSPTGSGFVLSGNGDCLSFYLSGSGVALRSYCGGGWRRVNLTVAQTDLRIEFRAASLLQPPLLLDLTMASFDPIDVGCLSADVVDLSSMTRGAFSSHRRVGQLAYRRGQVCAWRLPLGTGGLNLQLSSVSLHPGDCLQFLLNDDRSPRMQLCGPSATNRLLHWSPTADTAKQSLVLRFSAPTALGDAPETPSPPAGFFVKFDTGETCGNVSWNSDGSGGRLVSHTNYGFTRYLPGLLCRWLIQARPAYSLAIDVGLLQLGLGDCVHFYEASREPAARVGSHCGRDFGGSLAPSLPSLVTADNQLLVEFNSEADSTSGVGFGLTFRLLERPPCSGSSRVLLAPTVGSPPTILSSHPGYNQWNYAANQRCYAEVRAPSTGGRVSVEFAPNAELELPTERDIVRIYDGASAIDGKLILPPAVNGLASTTAEWSKFDVLGVLFSTDYSVQAAGFQLLFTGEMAPGSLPVSLIAIICGSIAGLIVIAIVVTLIVLSRQGKLSACDNAKPESPTIELDTQDSKVQARGSSSGATPNPYSAGSRSTPQQDEYTTADVPDQARGTSTARSGAMADEWQDEYTTADVNDQARGTSTARAGAMADEWQDEYTTADVTELANTSSTARVGQISLARGPPPKPPSHVSPESISRFDTPQPSKPHPSPIKPKTDQQIYKNVPPQSSQQLYQNVPPQSSQQLYQNLPSQHQQENQGADDVYDEYGDVEAQKDQGPALPPKRSNP